MVLAYHVIFGEYGFWLPNDPRGSWSEFVGSWELFRFGPATKTTERRSLAREPHNKAKRLAAKSALKFPAVHFTGIQAREIGRGFERRVTNSEMTVWACSILPERVHMVIGRHSYDVERMVALLKSEATEHLIGAQLHPLAEFQDAKGKYPSVCSRGEWKVFLDSPEDIGWSLDSVRRGKPAEGRKAAPELEIRRAVFANRRRKYNGWGRTRRFLRLRTKIEKNRLRDLHLGKSCSSLNCWASFCRPMR